MEDNMNKRPRPRRNVEATNIGDASQSVPSAPIAPSANAAEQLFGVTPTDNSAPIPNIVPNGDINATERARAADEARARARAAQGTGAAARVIGEAAAGVAENSQPKRDDKLEEELRESALNSINAAMQSFSANRPEEANEDDSEKTRLTDIQPKAKLKTPVRKKKEDKKSTGLLRGILKALIYITVVIGISCFLAYVIIIVGNDVFAFVKSDEIVVVNIPEDATVDDIADILGKNNIIRFPSLFKIYASFSGEDGVDEDGNSIFIPGEYQISPMNNYMQLLAAFQKQYTRDTVWVTFPEGTTVDEMITILVEEYGIASREEFVYAINEYDYELDFIKDLDTLEGRYYRLEGYLFPDTYQFYTDSSAETIVYKMLVNFQTKLNYVGGGKLEERLAELGMTLDEVVTLASIVEKEVKYPIDYDQVSSVFYNRLNNSANFPRLESDATTIYAIEMETGLRPATLEAYELGFDSPYNTRASKGLTPGAITNPGYEALYCAFYPAQTNYYYFVADVTGYNLYAQTLSGHNSNKESVRRAAEN